MNSAAMSSPGDGVKRPCRASDERKERSAFKLLAVIACRTARSLADMPVADWPDRAVALKIRTNSGESEILKNDDGEVQAAVFRVTLLV